MDAVLLYRFESIAVLFRSLLLLDAYVQISHAFRYSASFIGFNSGEISILSLGQ